MGLNKKITAIAIFLIILSNFIIATGYDISSDKDLNEFESDDYMDLTQSAVGEGLRTTTINFEFIIAVLILSAFAIVILFAIIYATKKKR